MKSLDKINDLIDMSKTGNGTWRLCDCTEDFELIKADLEVLEILNKHLIDIYNCYDGKMSYSEIRCIRLDDYCEESTGDYIKVKGWLEENQ